MQDASHCDSLPLDGLVVGCFIHDANCVAADMLRLLASVRVQLLHQFRQPWVKRLVDDGLVQCLEMPAEALSCKIA